MKEILTVGCEILGGYGTYESFDSQRSLLDADMVLLTINRISFQYRQDGMHGGKPLLTENESFRFAKSIKHWNRELKDVVDAGKTAFVLLGTLDEFLVKTGKKRYSDLARTKHSADVVESVSNYDALPLKMSVVPTEGKSMVLQHGGNPLKEYWDNYAAESEYRVYIEETEAFTPLVTTKNGQRVIGAIHRASSGGALVALPWLDLAKDEFFNEEDDEVAWTTDAKKWGEVDPINRTGG